MLLIAKYLYYYLFSQEVEHLRLLEETKPADPGRPLREVVLKSFLHGIKYESALSMLCPQEEEPHHKVSTIEESERLERSLKSLTDIIGSVTFSQNDHCNNIVGDNSVGTQKEKQNASLLCFESLKQNVQTMCPERNSQYPVFSSAAQRTSSHLCDEGEKVVLIY